MEVSITAIVDRGGFFLAGPNGGIDRHYGSCPDLVGWYVHYLSATLVLRGIARPAFGSRSFYVVGYRVEDVFPPLGLYYIAHSKTGASIFGIWLHGVSWIGLDFRERKVMEVRRRIFFVDGVRGNGIACLS